VNNCGNSVLTATGSNLLWSTGATTSSITVTSAGTYAVTSTLAGCISSSGSAIAIPLAVPSAPTISVVNSCGNSVLTTTGSNLLWSNSSTTPLITITSAGTYTVTQTVSGCISPAGSGVADPLAVPAAPTVSVLNNCGNSVLTASGANLLWSNNATTASITVNNAGTYSVTQSAAGCVSAATTTISNPLIIPTITNAGTTEPSVCSAMDATATIGGMGSGIVSWTGTNSGSISISLPGTVSGLSAGTYIFIYNNGCSSNNLTVNISDPSAPATPIVTVQDNCGNSVLTATGTNLLWSDGATTSSITVTTAGTYSVTQSSNGCLSQVASGIAAPNSNPIVSFGNLPTVCQNTPAFALTGGSPVGGTYSGPGVTANQFDPAAVVLGSWTIDYTYIDANGCESSASSTITVDPCVGIHENGFTIGVYPNPTSSNLTIESTEALQAYSIYDNSGRVLLSGNANGSLILELDLVNFSGGSYHIQVQSESRASVVKVNVVK